MATAVSGAAGEALTCGSSAGSTHCESLPTLTPGTYEYDVTAGGRTMRVSVVVGPDPGGCFSCGFDPVTASVSFTPTDVPMYAPLVCDPTAADHVAFGVQESAAFFGPEADRMYGRRFLIIDGSCRFFVGNGSFGEVRGGVLTPDELNAINAELLTGPWETIAGVHNAGVGADAWTDSLWRDERGGSCFLSCDGPAAAELTAMLSTAFRWESRLKERGTPLDGPIQLVLSAGSTTAIDAAVELMGTTDIAAALGDPSYGGTIRVSDALDVVALRALRDALSSPLYSRVALREGGLYYSALVIDAIPHANADGRLLPPFPIMDYGPPR